MLSTLKALWENGEKNDAAQESLLQFALMSLRALCIQKADPEAEKSMGIKIVQLLLHDLKFQAINNHDDLYRIYEIIFERGQTMPLSEYYRRAYEEGMLRRNKKFYIGWINACNTEENLKMKREAIAKARENIPDIDKDQTFSALANVSELDNTCAIFKRRSTVAALRARKIPNVITTGQRQKMMVPEAVLNGNSNEELLVAKLSDLYRDDDMDISVIEDAEPIGALMNSKKINVEMSKLPRPSLCFAQTNPTINDLSPIVEDQDHENSTNGCPKAPRLVTARPLTEDPSPARAPSGSKKNRVEPEPEIAYGSQSPGLSFTTKITREAQNIFSETVTFQGSRGKELDFDAEQKVVEPTENAQFEVFCDQEKTYVEPAPVKNEQPVDHRKPFAQLNPAANMTFDINEPTVAGTWKMGSTGQKIFTSSPLLAKNQHLSDTMFLELALNASKEKPEEQLDDATKVLAHLSAEQDFDEEAKDKWPGMTMGASTFAKRRSFFTGRSSLVGRSSLSGSLMAQNQQEEQKGTAAMPAAPTKQEVRIVNTDEVSPMVDLDSTGIGLPEQNVTSQLNPWSPELRNSIMANFQEMNVHDIAETCSQLRVGSLLKVSGEEFAVDGLLGEGGFAKVYRARNEEGLAVALKYEVPSCAWEAYILQAVHNRISTEIGPAIMKIDDMYIFRNASLIVNEYLSMGNMLQCINNVAGEVSYSVVLHLFIQLARILKEVHAARIIHGDVKPDNVMFIGKLPEGLSLHADDLLSAEPIIRLIDWGRAIDLSSLPNGASFRGRAGTQCFDCPEMLNDRPWTYQTDYFSFAASLHVGIFKTYGKVVEDTNGFMFEKPLPRRRPEAPYIREVIFQMLNIPSCEAIPSWDNIIEKLTTAFKLTFRSTQWAEEAKRYNAAIVNFKPGC